MKKFEYEKFERYLRKIKSRRRLMHISRKLRMMLKENPSVVISNALDLLWEKIAQTRMKV